MTLWLIRAGSRGEHEQKFLDEVPGVNYVGGSRQLRWRVHLPSPPVRIGGEGSEN